MYEKLSTCFLPLDDLFHAMVQREACPKTREGISPVNQLLTLEVVMNLDLRQIARSYITKLLSHKEKYGYLYFLSTQPLLLPLDLHFHGVELFVESSNQDEIVAHIEALAKEFGCPHTLLYDITLLELYYFYFRLVNPHLTWLAIESILHNVKQHSHLLISPHRPYPVRTA